MRFRPVTRGLLALCVMTALFVMGPTTSRAAACSGEPTDINCIIADLPDCDDVTGNCSLPPRPTYCPPRIEVAIATGGIFLSWRVETYCYGDVAPGDAVDQYWGYTIHIRETVAGGAPYIVNTSGSDGYVRFTNNNTGPRNVGQGVHNCSLTPGVLTYGEGTGIAQNRFDTHTSSSGAAVYCN